MVLQADRYDFMPTRRALLFGGPADCGALRMFVHFDIAGEVLDGCGAKDGATMKLYKQKWREKGSNLYAP